MNARTDHLLGRLRAAAALAHVVPDLAVEVAVDHGPRLVVSHRAELRPDVDPCEFRRMVRRVVDRDPLAVGFGWLSEVTSLVVGGPGVSTAEGVVILEGVDGPDRLTAFTTDLDTPLVMQSARRLAEEWIERDPCAVLSLRQVQIRVDRDEAMGASVVTLPWCDADLDESVLVTSAIAARCAVDALLAGTMSPSS